MYVPDWVKRRWREEYVQNGTASVASPNNGWAVAVYFVQAFLGIGHATGVTTPSSFAVVFGTALLLPWALLYLVAGFFGTFAVLFLRRVDGGHMQWARPEMVAAVGLAVANGMYLASLFAGYVGDRFPYITVLVVSALFAGALSRSAQIAGERVKSAYVAGLAKE